MVAKIDVLVAAATPPDVQAPGIAAAVRTCPDMTLVADRLLSALEAKRLLPAMPRSSPCALVLVGIEEPDASAFDKLAIEWRDLVVLRVDVIEAAVEIAVRDVGLDALLRALRELLGRWDRPRSERRSHVVLRIASRSWDNRPVKGPR
jgi:hypothetical protein